MEMISQAEGEDMLSDILTHISEDEDYLEALSEKFELEVPVIRSWLERVKVRASDVHL
jgi:hypothetical protein